MTTYSIQEQILDAITTLMDDIDGVTVAERSRTTPLSKSQTPAIVITAGEAKSEQTSPNILQWNLQVKISIIVRGEVPDRVADPILCAAWSSLLADLTLGGLSQNIVPDTRTPNLYDVDGIGGVIDLDCTVTYRTLLSDPTRSS